MCFDYLPMTVDLLTIGLMCLLRLQLGTAGQNQTNNKAHVHWHEPYWVTLIFDLAFRSAIR